MALRKKDIAGHLGTQIHRNHVSKHPNGPGGDPARFVISAERPHIVTASNKIEDDTDLLVWCKEKSQEKWKKMQSSTVVAPDAFQLLEGKCSTDQQRQLLDGLRAMIGPTPVNNNDQVEMETETEFKIMSEDDEAASAVRGLLEAEKQVAPVNTTPLHQIQPQVENREEDPQIREDPRKMEESGPRKRKCDLESQVPAKRQKEQEQNEAEKENRQPDRPEKEKEQVQQEKGKNMEKPQHQRKNTEYEELLEHNFQPDYNEEEESSTEQKSVAPVVGRMLRDCLETMVTSLKKVTSNDPLETAMVGVMNHLSTTNQNLGNLATAIESNQNRNKDHDIWASRIRMDTEELTRAVSSLKTEVRGVADSNRAIVESLNSFNSSVKSMFEKISMLTQQAIEGYATVSAKLGEHSTILKNIQDKSDEPPKKKPEKENRLGYNSRDSPYEMREFEAHWDRVTEEEESRRSYQRHQERRHHSQHRRPRYDKR